MEDIGSDMCAGDVELARGAEVDSRIAKGDGGKVRKRRVRRQIRGERRSKGRGEMNQQRDGEERKGGLIVWEGSGRKEVLIVCDWVGCAG